MGRILIDSSDSSHRRSAQDDTAADRGKPSRSPLRAQTNVDFVIAVFIITVFFSATLFTSGSPLVAGDHSEIDYRLDAQQSLVELTGELRDDDGQLDESNTAALLDSGSLDSHLSTDDNVAGNLTLRPTNTNSSASLFGDEESARSVGPAVPRTTTSTASKTVRLDSRATRMELTLWVDTA